MDKLVGLIWATLDEVGLRDNTLILFSSDNESRQHVRSKMGPLKIKGGKGTMKDTGSHVPLVANWKGTTPKGVVCDDLIDFTDMLPTFAEIAGASIPTPHTVDGRSFLPQLRGKKGKPREWVFIQRGKNCAVRTKRWKLLCDGSLYDLTADPREKSPIMPGRETAESTVPRKILDAVLRVMKN